MPSIQQAQKFEVNRRQRRWSKLIKDYDMIIDSHPRKVNVVTDALSWKSSIILAYLRTTFVSVLMDMWIVGISLDYDGN